MNSNVVDRLDPLVGLIAGPLVRLKLKLGIKVCAWKFENLLRPQ